MSLALRAARMAIYRGNIQTALAMGRYIPGLHRTASPMSVGRTPRRTTHAPRVPPTPSAPALSPERTNELGDRRRGV